MSLVLRKFVLTLLTLAVLAGPMPMAAHAAMPGMDMPMGKSMAMDKHGNMAMPCDQHKPMPAHDTPCDRACCMCVLGNAALSGPTTVAPASLSMIRLVWSAERRPDSLAQKPALPPPIA